MITSPPPTTTTAEPYNYDRFRSSAYDLARFEGPSVGQSMPPLRLSTTDREVRTLADYSGRTVVLETGSITCPMYVKGIPAMNHLAQRHPDVVFVMLYVREAHPGERIGPHRSDAAKRDRASVIAPVLGDQRTILVDDVRGTAHRELGLLPNMVYVVGPDGTVLFRGDWTDPWAVEAALNGTAGPAELAREHFPPAKPSPHTAINTLLRGGWLAVFDFAVAVPGLLAQHRRADQRHRTNPPR